MRRILYHLDCRAWVRGLHGHKHIAHQRRNALLMITTGLIRVAVWLSLLLCYLLHLSFAQHLFASVAFVSILSVLALALTDWGQVAASMAQLTAGDAHHDSERTRAYLVTDFRQVEQDVARLAELQPGPAAIQLAAEIRARLQGEG